MTIVTNSWPVIARADAGVVVVSRWVVDTPERQRAAVEATIAEWLSGPWPAGLVSFNGFVSTDGRAVLNYAQWTSEEEHSEFIRPSRTVQVRRIDDAVPDIKRTELVRYRLYRSQTSQGAAQVPGCVVVADVEFDSPYRQRQRAWADAALDTDAAPLGRMSDHIHLSTDGSQVLDYAEWVDEEAHIEALGSASANADWRQVQAGQGIRRGEVDRYHLHRSLSRS